MDGRTPFLNDDQDLISSATIERWGIHRHQVFEVYDIPGKDNEKQKILKRAARELYRWSKLKHPNILPLMGLAMFRGHLSMISKWMENGCLVAYISLNPNADRLSLCIDVCAGLSHIHASNMVHGDIKAANVMVSGDDIGMIADFGNSQLRDLTLKFTNTTSSSLSVRWAAPELLSGVVGESQVSKESDVYAYGMTVLETMTGKVPFEEFNEHQVLVLVALQRRAPARPEVGISNETWNLLQSCWAREKPDRPSIGSIERLLRDIYFQRWVDATRQDNPADSHFKARAQPSTRIHAYANLERTDLLGYDIQMNESAMPCIKPNSTGSSNGPSREYGRKLRTLSDLTKKYAGRGQLAEAESLGVEVVAVTKRVLGDDHPDTLQNMNNLVVTYVRRGRLVEAESLGVAVVAARKRVLGEDDPHTLHSMSNLAVAYNKLDRLAEVESLGVAVMVARKRTLGEDHPDTLRDMINLVAIYEKQGRLSEAQSLGVEVVAFAQRVLGEAHPDTLRSMNNLVVVYGKQGRLSEAESVGFEVMTARKRTFGEDHPDTLRSMSNLVVTYVKQGRLAEAESMGVKVLTTRERVLGKNHLDTVNITRLLELVYQAQGRQAPSNLLVGQVDNSQVVMD